MGRVHRHQAHRASWVGHPVAWLDVVERTGGGLPLGQGDGLEDVIKRQGFAGGFDLNVTDPS